MSKEIPLTKGYVAIVDDEDYEALNAFKWQVTKHKNTGKTYAVRNIRKADGSQKTVFMHRFITGAGARMQVDHINRDGLDNRRANLRICTSVQNACNRHQKRILNKSIKFKGVEPLRGGYFRARIRIENITYHLGVYETAEAAAVAYDIGAKFYHKEFAHLNGLDHSLALPPLTKVRGKIKCKSKYPYKGILDVYKNGHAQAGITVHDKRVRLGTFATIELAAQAYNEAAIKYHGDKAILNVIPPPADK